MIGARSPYQPTEAMVTGLIYLYRRDPQRVVDVGLVHIDLEPELDPEVAS